MNSALLPTLASLALQVPHLESFHRRLNEAIFLRTGGSVEKGADSLHEIDVVRALEDACKQQDGGTVLEEQARLPGAAGPSPSSKVRSKGGAAVNITPRRRGNSSASASTHSNKRAKTSTQPSLEQGSDVNHSDLFEKEKPLPDQSHVKTKEPRIFKDPFTLTGSQIKSIMDPIKMVSRNHELLHVAHSLMYASPDLFSKAKAKSRMSLLNWRMPME